MEAVALFLVALFLAAANGANDNFKGVATLYGSGILGYRGAIAFATVTTLAGSLTALFLAGELVARFSGKGLVPMEEAGSLDFLVAVGMGAAGTVWLATRLGLPISTTHALVGGLVGGGAMASSVDLSRLGEVFLLPLLVSPLLAALLALALYLGAKHGGSGRRPRQFPAGTDPARPQSRMNAIHLGSAGMVSFARGLNDTPKITALLVAVPGLALHWGMTAVAMAIAIGGLSASRRVGETLGHRITHIDHGRGLCANLVTGAMVLFASHLGVPVSTTHVSVGALFGIGVVGSGYRKDMARAITMAWLFTLPGAGGIAALTYLTLS